MREGFMSEGEKDRGYDQGADRAKKEMMKKNAA